MNVQDSLDAVETDVTSKLPEGLRNYLELLKKIEELVDVISDQLVKDTQVKTKWGGYSYMKLDDLHPLVSNQCKAMNLHLSYPAFDGYQGACITDLETGAKEQCMLPFPPGLAEMQDYGKFSTYLKRYAVFGVMGLPGATDNDAQPTQPKSTGRTKVKPVHSYSNDLPF